MAECFSKNMTDKDEYSQTAEIENRCIKIVSRLFHAPEEGVGVSAIGSPASPKQPAPSFAHWALE